MSWIAAKDAAPWVFRAEGRGAAVAFTGRTAPPERTSPPPRRQGSREQVLARLTAEPPQVAWARQVHSARVLLARPGESGEGDALVSRGSGLALSIVTADCVPVLLAGPRAIAAAHAGWRGIAAGV
ncbi:MAG: polyphenol oxidase family protein, partial [Acidobacteria bacterium]|nr:polyphenol oxidase family protein [Acidobacteriota bacterium]